MKLQEVLQAAGRSKRRRRSGRGSGSGRGKTCGRGHKGAGQRAGRKHRYGYEGGQNPALFRIPKRGFSNVKFRTVYQVVNVGALEAFEDGARVDVEALAQKRLIRPGGGPVKILGTGNVRKKLTVVAHAFSASAGEKIRAAGGTIQQLER